MMSINKLFVKMRLFLFFLFFYGLFLYSFCSYAINSEDKSIYYYFELNQEKSDLGFSGCQNICSGSTPSQKPYPDCSCYCSLTHCDPGYKLEDCRCVLDCLNGVDNNGDCCPPDNYDLANCITTEIEKNGCYTYASDCTDGKVCNGNGNCVCPDNRPVWTGTACVECSIPTNLTCPIASEEVDENGCPLYREKVCEDGEILTTDCECVKTICKADGQTCVKDSECCSNMCREDGICISCATATAVGTHCPAISVSCCGINAQSGNSVGTDKCFVWARSDDGCSKSLSACFIPHEECSGEKVWSEESCECICDKVNESCGVNMHYDENCECVCDTGFIKISEDMCQKCNPVTNEGCSYPTDYCDDAYQCVECITARNCGDENLYACEYGVCKCLGFLSGNRCCPIGSVDCQCPRDKEASAWYMEGDLFCISYYLATIINGVCGYVDTGFSCH